MKLITLMYFIIECTQMLYGFHPNTYFKCCHKEEHLSQNKQCVLPSKIQTFNTEEYGKVRKGSEPLWVPEAIRSRGYTIRYGAFPCSSEYLNFIRITENLAINISFTGRLFIHSNQTNLTQSFNEYCFDYIKGGNTSLAILACTMSYRYIDKCCPFGKYVKYLNGTAKCENGDAFYTSVLIKNQTYNLLYRDINKYFCDNSSLQLFEDRDDVNDSMFMNSLTHRLPIRYWMYDRYTCTDSAWVKGNFQTDTKIYCRRSQTLRGLYVLSQPLILVAAFCLLLMLFAMCTVPELTSSSPGKALFCHISCLFMVYLIRSIWFFNFLRHESSILQTPEQTNCRNYALAVYFFLTASGFWLNVLSIDTADRFRRCTTVGGVAAGERRRFVIFAVYAWGGTVALTARCGIKAFGISDSQRPTFQETRTCYYESQFRHPGGRQKTLEYYYGPMGVLFLVNLALYAYIAVKLFRIYEATSAVENPQNPPPPHRSATVLVRLLLLLGGIEWAAEMTGWGTRRQPRPGRQIPGFGRLAHPDDELHSEHALRLALNLLDVLRAGCLLWVCCGRPRVRRRLADSMRRAMSRGERGRQRGQPRGRIEAVGGSSAARVSKNPDVSECGGRRDNQATEVVTPTSNATDMVFSFTGSSLRRLCFPIPLKVMQSLQATKEIDNKSHQELEMENVSNNII